MPDEVVASPRAARLPEDHPTFGSRPDRHGYDGVHHIVWWSATGVRSAVYAPDTYSDETVEAGLARALAEIEAYDLDAEAHRPPQHPRHPIQGDAELRVEQVTMSVDAEGITGPGRMSGSCDDDRDLPTEREALTAAAADIRRRLDLPEQA